MLDVYSTLRAVSSAFRTNLPSSLIGFLFAALLTTVPPGAIGAHAVTPAEVFIGFSPPGTQLSQETRLTAGMSVVTGKRPVLFVHGHNLQSETDEDFNFRKNWQLPLNGLPSFRDALEHPDNAGLDIEPYFIRFTMQNRSIVDDAHEIEWAIEHILARHDGSYDPVDENRSTTIKVAIIAYSKGTISTRCYLKSLRAAPPEPGPCNFRTPRDGFNPVSEFVAIAPPNHGLAAGLTALGSGLALKELNDGYTRSCLTLSSADWVRSRDFIKKLNGHPTTDSERNGSQPGDWVPGPYDDEAPGSRTNGSNSNSGTLYLSLYADGELTQNGYVSRDFVGGHYPSDDCRGRRFARNLATDAENIAMSAIPDPSVVSAIPEVNEAAVHKNTVHTPEVICNALYAVSHHNLPADDYDDDDDAEMVTCETDGQIPMIPEQPIWPWWIWLAILFALIGPLIIVTVIWRLKTGDG